MTYAFHPLHNYVLVSRVEAPKTGSIIIPDTAQHDIYHAEVVAVGPGTFSAQGVKLPTYVEPGDLVVYNARGSEVQLNGKGLWVIHEGQILGVLRPDDADARLYCKYDRGACLLPRASGCDYCVAHEKSIASRPIPM